jgi:hypothetical protein
MRGYVIDIVWSVIDTQNWKPWGELRAQNGGFDRETEEERGQRLEGRGDAHPQPPMPA